MAKIKTSIKKDWWKDKPTAGQAMEKVVSFESVSVKSSEDLPELLTPKEVASLLKKHIKTIEQWRNDGRIKFFKIMGRYFTTPSLVAEFLESELKKYG